MKTYQAVIIAMILQAMPSVGNAAACNQVFETAEAQVLSSQVTLKIDLETQDKGLDENARAGAIFGALKGKISPDEAVGFARAVFARMTSHAPAEVISATIAGGMISGNSATIAAEIALKINSEILPTRIGNNSRAGAVYGALIKRLSVGEVTHFSNVVFSHMQVNVSDEVISAAIAGGLISETSPAVAAEIALKINSEILPARMEDNAKAGAVYGALVKKLSTNDALNFANLVFSRMQIQASDEVIGAAISAGIIAETSPDNAATVALRINSEIQPAHGNRISAAVVKNAFPKN